MHETPICRPDAFRTVFHQKTSFNETLTQMGVYLLMDIRNSPHEFSGNSKRNEISSYTENIR